MHNNSQSAIFLRILAAYGIEDDHGAVDALAKKMRLAQSTVSGWKTRGVSSKGISQTADETGCSSDWLRTGRGGMSPPEDSNGTVSEDPATYGNKPTTALTIHRGASAEAWELLDHFETMTAENKKALLTLARAITGKQPEGK